jgi:hypothetical protein
LAKEMCGFPLEQKKLIFLNVHVYYVPSMELNLLSVSQIMWHNPQLDVNFRNHKCYMVGKETNKIVALGVEGPRIVQTGRYWIGQRACTSSQECIKHQYTLASAIWTS